MKDAGLPMILRFEGIQALRAFAAFLVLWTHVKHTGNFSGIPWINNPIGVIGVDVFFVISGFIISLSAKSLQYDARQFFINRITRIAPIYWLTAIPLIIASLLQNKSSWQAMASTFTFLPIFDFGTYRPPTNNFGWTLGFEFWFYLSSAVVMALFADATWKVLALFLLIGAYLIRLFYTGSYTLPHFIFNPILMEFFFGILIFKHMHLLKKKMIIPFALAAGYLFYVICMGLQDGSLMFDAKASVIRSLIGGGFGACLVLTVVAAEIHGFRRWPQWATMLGECSFSIYLLQPYSLWLANNMARHLKLGAWTSGSIFLAASVLMGILSTIYLEKPLTRAVRKMSTRMFSRPGDRARKALVTA